MSFLSSNATRNMYRNAGAPNAAPAAVAAPGGPSTAASKLSDGVEKTKNFFKKFTEGKLPVIILVIGMILLFVIVIVYIIFSMKNSKLAAKQLTTKPIKLDELAKPIEIPAADIPKAVVGMEYSYSFWIYIQSYDQTFSKDANGKTTPSDKVIFYRGTEGDIATANPVVFMDGLSNKLNIAIKTQGSSLTSIPNMVDYNGNLYNIKFMNYFLNNDLKLRDTSNPRQPAINKHIILTVDYVPLQRWVNVTVVVDNKVCSVFMDGEIYSVKSSEEFKSIREPELDLRGRPIDVNMIVDKTDGGIYIGKGSVGSRNTIPGYLGKLFFFNYAMSINEVKKVYEQGPIGKNILGPLSVNYGLRNPLYKLNEDAVKTN